MFLENTINFKKSSGVIEIICGSMFYGIAKMLILRLKGTEIVSKIFLLYNSVEKLVMLGEIENYKPLNEDCFQTVRKKKNES